MIVGLVIILVSCGYLKPIFSLTKQMHYAMQHRRCLSILNFLLIALNIDICIAFKKFDSNHVTIQPIK